MIILDKFLKLRKLEGNPIRVGMIGAGFMASGIAEQLINIVPGIHLSAIYNRDMQKARVVYNNAGINTLEETDEVDSLDRNIRDNKFTVVSDPGIICRSENIDVVLEVTGAVEFSANIAMETIRNKKHIVLMNAELDGTVGPLLKHYADEARVVYTNVDGDQPGVLMNLYRFVKGLGIRPVLCGNIKGLQDPYRNPATQEGFAKQWGQTPSMVTSFADGTKISFEQAVIANATGMLVAKRGMHGPTVEPGTPIEEAINWFPEKEMLSGNGIVDYVIGASPNPGVFIIGHQDSAFQQHYLNYYKLGDGPFYCFYTPYHLCHLEIHNTIGRAVIFSDPVIAPVGSPYVDVVATAKVDLKKGQVIDGIGHYHTYGQCENTTTSLRENLLPMGIAEGCIMKTDISKDTVLTFDMVSLPDNLICKLWQKQKEYFGGN